MKILILAPYPPNESPSQRYRFEHYLRFLPGHQIEYDYRTFFDLRAWKIIFTKGNHLRKIAGLLRGFLSRWALMLRVAKYDFVYIHREAAPMGPPIFEWIIAKIYRKRIIYDFDDAIWIPSVSAYNKMARHLKWFSKVGTICKWSYKVSVGNDFLGDFARKYSRQVILVPTVVDTELVHNKLQDQETDQPTVGWTGTFSTLKYLAIVLPVLQKLQQSIDFTFIVIADRDPKLPLNKYKFIKWRKETEAEDLLTIHIGLMPLSDDDLARGKCGFKAIQYMSLGIPAVVSPVGVNTKIVEDSKNGFVCDTPEEWESKLTQLLKNTELRSRLGKASHEKIETAYSVKSTENTFIGLFQ